MWSVVHLPFVFIRSGISSSSLPSQALKGSSFCKRFESLFITTSISELSSEGAIKPLSSTANPLGGNTSPFGSSSFTSFPLRSFSVSVAGLKSSRPAIAKAVVSSGPAINAYVLGLPSARRRKLRLNEVTMAFLRSLSSVCRFHCPMQGPQAFVIITAPIFLKSSNIPSRSAVYLICSEPGLIIS